MGFKLADNKKVGASVGFSDARGNDAQVQGAPVWSSSDESIATVVAADDGMTATISATGPLGTAQISVTADADLGDGVVPVGGLLDIEVVASQAVSANISVGEPEDQ